MTETNVAPPSPPASPSPPPALDFGAALRDAFVAALIALGLAAPMMGLVAVPSSQGLSLEGHWSRVAIAVAIVFAGRLLLNLTVWRPGARKRKLKISPQTEAVFAKVARYLAPLAIALAIVFPFLPGAGRTQVDLGILILTYVMLGWGLNIVVGLAGQLDLGYVAFYAVGAYSYALLAQNFGWSFWLCLPVAGILAAFWGVLLGFPVLRLRGDYLAIVTLAFGEIIRIILLNWSWFTGGPNGIGGIPKPSFFGVDFVSESVR